VKDDPGAECLHAVLQAGQATAAGQAGAADSVVADRDAQEVTDDLCLDADAEAWACLAALVSALSHDVIGADLDRLRQPLFGMDLQVDGDRAAAGECLEREAEAALGQDRGVDAARDLAQIVQRAGHHGDGGRVPRRGRAAPRPLPRAAAAPA
jgi:hypothetical protein